MSSQKPQQTYFSNGRALESPPLSVRAFRFLDSAYTFLGLYFVSLFSLDTYAAAQASQFNVYNRQTAAKSSSRFGVSSGTWGGSGGGGGGGPPGPGSGPGRRIGRVDDVRGPECGSGSCRG